MVASGVQHYKWAGDSVQRGQAHSWVRKELLKTLPLICTKCGSDKNIELASINGHIYTRNLSDYTFLCKRCHNEMDGMFYHLKQGVDAIYNSPRYNPTMTEKKCTKCGITKPLSEFYKDGDGIRSDCKLCSMLRCKSYRDANGDTPLLDLWESVSEGYRTCTKCGVKKPLCDFYIQSTRKTGTTSHCIECLKIAYKIAYSPKTAATSRVIKQREDMARGVRTCKGCGVEKPLAKYSPKGDTTHAYCKLCYNERSRTKRKLKREQIY